MGARKLNIQMYKGNKSGAGANLISAFKVSNTSDHEMRFANINLQLGV